VSNNIYVKGKLADGKEITFVSDSKGGPHQLKDIQLKITRPEVVYALAAQLGAGIVNSQPAAYAGGSQSAEFAFRTGTLGDQVFQQGTSTFHGYLDGVNYGVVYADADRSLLNLGTDDFRVLETPTTGSLKSTNMAYLGGKDGKTVVFNDMELESKISRTYRPGDEAKAAESVGQIKSDLVKARNAIIAITPLPDDVKDALKNNTKYDKPLDAENQRALDHAEEALGNVEREASARLEQAFVLPVTKAAGILDISGQYGFSTGKLVVDASVMDNKGNETQLLSWNGTRDNWTSKVTQSIYAVNNARGGALNIDEGNLMKGKDMLAISSSGAGINLADVVSGQYDKGVYVKTFVASGLNYEKGKGVILEQSLSSDPDIARETFKSLVKSGYIDFNGAIQNKFRDLKDSSEMNLTDELAGGKAMLFGFLKQADSGTFSLVPGSMAGWVTSLGSKDAAARFAESPQGFRYIVTERQKNPASAVMAALTQGRPDETNARAEFASNAGQITAGIFDERTLNVSLGAEGGIEMKGQGYGRFIKYNPAGYALNIGGDLKDIAHNSVTGQFVNTKTWESIPESMVDRSYGQVLTAVAGQAIWGPTAWEKTANGGSSVTGHGWVPEHLAIENNEVNDQTGYFKYSTNGGALFGAEDKAVFGDLVAVKTYKSGAQLKAMGYQGDEKEMSEGKVFSSFDMTNAAAKTATLKILGEAKHLVNVKEEKLGAKAADMLESMTGVRPTTEDNFFGKTTLQMFDNKSLENDVQIPETTATREVGSNQLIDALERSGAKLNDQQKQAINDVFTKKQSTEARVEALKSVTGDVAYVTEANLLHSSEFHFVDTSKQGMGSDFWPLLRTENFGAQSIMTGEGFRPTQTAFTGKNLDVGQLLGAGDEALKNLGIEKRVLTFMDGDAHYDNDAGKQGFVLRLIDSRDAKGRPALVSYPVPGPIAPAGEPGNGGQKTLTNGVDGQIETLAGVKDRASSNFNSNVALHTYMSGNTPLIYGAIGTTTPEDRSHLDRETTQTLKMDNNFSSFNEPDVLLMGGKAADDRGAVAYHAQPLSDTMIPRNDQASRYIYGGEGNEWNPQLISQSKDQEHSTWLAQGKVDYIKGTPYIQDASYGINVSNAKGTEAITWGYFQGGSIQHPTAFVAFNSLASSPNSTPFSIGWSPLTRTQMIGFQAPKGQAFSYETVEPGMVENRLAATMLTMKGINPAKVNKIFGEYFDVSRMDMESGMAEMYKSYVPEKPSVQWMIDNNLPPNFVATGDHVTLKPGREFRMNEDGTLTAIPYSFNGAELLVNGAWEKQAVYSSPGGTAGSAVRGSANYAEVYKNDIVGPYSTLRGQNVSLLGSAEQQAKDNELLNIIKTNDARLVYALSNNGQAAAFIPNTAGSIYGLSSTVTSGKDNVSMDGSRKTEKGTIDVVSSLYHDKGKENIFSGMYIDANGVKYGFGTDALMRDMSVKIRGTDQVLASNSIRFNEANKVTKEEATQRWTDEKFMDLVMVNVLQKIGKNLITPIKELSASEDPHRRPTLDIVGYKLGDKVFSTEKEAQGKLQLAAAEALVKKDDSVLVALVGRDSADMLLKQANAEIAKNGTDLRKEASTRTEAWMKTREDADVLKYENKEVEIDGKKVDVTYVEGGWDAVVNHGSAVVTHADDFSGPNVFAADASGSSKVAEGRWDPTAIVAEGKWQMDGNNNFMSDANGQRLDIGAVQNDHGSLVFMAAKGRENAAVPVGDSEMLKTVGLDSALLLTLNNFLKKDKSGAAAQTDDKEKILRLIQPAGYEKSEDKQHGVALLKNNGQVGFKFVGLSDEGVLLASTIGDRTTGVDLSQIGQTQYSKLANDVIGALQDRGGKVIDINNGDTKQRYFAMPVTPAVEDQMNRYFSNNREAVVGVTKEGHFAMVSREATTKQTLVGSSSGNWSPSTSTWKTSERTISETEYNDDSKFTGKLKIKVGNLYYVVDPDQEMTGLMGKKVPVKINGQISLVSYKDWNDSRDPGKAFAQGMCEVEVIDPVTKEKKKAMVSAEDIRKSNENGPDYHKLWNSSSDIKIVYVPGMNKVLQIHAGDIKTESQNDAAVSKLAYEGGLDNGGAHDWHNDGTIRNWFKFNRSDNDANVSWKDVSGQTRFGSYDGNAVLPLLTYWSNTYYSESPALNELTNKVHILNGAAMIKGTIDAVTTPIFVVGAAADIITFFKGAPGATMAVSFASRQAVKWATKDILEIAGRGALVAGKGFIKSSVAMGATTSYLL
ncbi:MAG: hypothetical protein HQL22_11700, partial [Candidatus Omnitrophica bacterium]|nr:hypothetical protein [Candidatus Omnitrophota bacterium]